MQTARCAPPPAGSGTATTAGDHARDVTDGQHAPIADSVSTGRSRKYMVLHAQNIQFRLRLPCALRPADSASWD